eukprot:scaffold6064_cov173-Amphora_coffeaeformis.AAC.5
MKIAILYFFVTGIQAFAPTIRSRTAPLRVVLTDAPLGQVDEMCIENVADICLEQAMECDLEEFEALVNQLTSQRGYHAEQLVLIDDLLIKLSGRGVNGATDASSTSP